MPFDPPYGWPFDVMSERAIIDYGDVAFDYADTRSLPGAVQTHIAGILQAGAASVTQIHTGTVDNVIPDTAYINGTVRTFAAHVRTMVMDRMEAIVRGQALSYGVEAELDYEIGYPATINDPEKAAFAAGIARDVAGADRVIADAGREMGSEDFSYMLERRPGAYLFLGQGPGAGLHHPEYDFNDAVAPVGASFFARLVERAQPIA
jgi:hippurate hydrolase